MPGEPTSTSWVSLGRRVIKLPPEKLREKVDGSGDASEYLTVGVRSASTIFHVLRSNGCHLGSFQRILDFACGGGGTLNFLRGYAPVKHLYGCDCDPELAAWCQRSLDMEECVAIRACPPTPFPDSHFDFIYSLSFFTRLDPK